MLPDNNPINNRVEFSPLPQLTGEGGGAQPTLPPEIQDVANKVQHAATQPGKEGSKGVPLTENSKGFYPHIDPVRLTTPRELKEAAKKILEKLIALLPVKLPATISQAAQAQPTSRESAVEQPTYQKPPANKLETVAKGEALASNQRQVAEEVEGISRTQEDIRLNRQALPKGKETAKDSARNEQIPSKIPFAVEKSPLQKENMQSETGFKPESEQHHSRAEMRTPPKDHETKGAQEKGQLAQLQASQPPQDTFIPIFPQPYIVPPKSQYLPEETERRVEEVQRVEGVQPVQREASFRFDKNDPTGGVIPIHSDDRDIVRIPLTPDLPLTRQNLFKKAHRGSSKWEEEEGYALGDIVHMLLCAFICGAKDTSEAWRYLQGRSAVFQKWLNLKKGIPSYRLIALLLARLTPSALELLLQAVTAQNFPQQHLQRIHVWETDRGILCAQSERELYKTTPGQVLDLFDIKNSIVQLDLPKLDPALARTIRKKEGHYLHRVRATEEAIHAQLLAGFKKEVDYRDVREMSRSTELREITIQSVEQIADNERWIDLKWSDLKGAVRFNSEILTPSKHWVESRIYLTDLPLDANQFVHTLRTLALPAWVEWLVDCDFTDWSCNNISQHCETLKRFAWQLLEQHSQNPLDVRKRAQTDTPLLAEIIRMQ